ncbi:hypothetical protein [Catenovulum adriaticum]|uniref:Uncharacterized protein n=1 Tax=Catenovulum adriaticum TaxID=2984846 RepID=A0ABY7AKS5_9ALTE|nr:hypothetical protein [Catenovulum sp. TS8]WAJ70124.1 hypothetical protein OLW01_13425 [Catenovulum sp. TS8]
MAQPIKRVTITKRKEPLTDFATLAIVGRHAARSARAKAIENGVGYTFAKEGRIMKKNADGSTQVVKIMDDFDDFPSLEDELCQG